MDVIIFILGAGVLVFASYFFAWLFDHTTIPNVLLLMFVGVVIGPWLGILRPDFFGEAGQLAAIVVLVVLLFEGGLELKWPVLRAAWKIALKLTIASFVFMMLVTALAGSWLLSFSLPVAVIFGVIVGGVSSAVVIPLLQQLRLDDESGAVLFLESVLSDVFAIVIAVALIGAYGEGHLDGATVVQSIAISFFGAVALGAAAAFVWSRLLGVIRHMRNSLFATPAFVLVLFGLVEQIGLSGPIAALAFGVTLGNMGSLKQYLMRKRPFLYFLLMPTSPSNRERAFFREAVFLLETFFFVFVGLSLSFTYLWVQVVAIIVVLLMLLVRLFVTRLAIPMQTPRSSAVVMSIMVPKGLAAAALAALPVRAGMPGGAELQEVVYVIIFWSVLFTSLLIFATDRTSLKGWYESFFSRFGGKTEVLYPERKDVL